MIRRTGKLYVDRHDHCASEGYCHVCSRRWSDWSSNRPSTLTSIRRICPTSLTTRRPTDLSTTSASPTMAPTTVHFTYSATLRSLTDYDFADRRERFLALMLAVHHKIAPLGLGAKNAPSPCRAILFVTWRGLSYSVKAPRRHSRLKVFWTLCFCSACSSAWLME